MIIIAASPATLSPPNGRLEASRRGNDRDGRRYTIEVSATDHAGNLGSTSATGTVPHH